MRNTTTLLAVVFLGLASALAQGQASRISPQERQQFLDCPLTLRRANQLIAAKGAMTRYLVSLPDSRDRLVRWTKTTPAERREQLEKDPKAAAILRQDGLTAQEYMVGVPALRMTLMAAQGLANSPDIVASPANVAFGKANPSEFGPKTGAADGVGGRR